MSEDEIKRGGVLRKDGHHKGSSGEHPIMQAVRKKLDSIREGTLPEVEALNARIERVRQKVRSDPPAVEGPSGEESVDVTLDEIEKHTEGCVDDTIPNTLPATQHEEKKDEPR